MGNWKDQYRKIYKLKKTSKGKEWYNIQSNKLMMEELEGGMNTIIYCINMYKIIKICVDSFNLDEISIDVASECDYLDNLIDTMYSIKADVENAKTRINGDDSLGEIEKLNIFLEIAPSYTTIMSFHEHLMILNNIITKDIGKETDKIISGAYRSICSIIDKVETKSQS